MEKQITIEKQKKLKNETMFNFKNVSLMKKQLFSLMMAFALVVGLSVSALAQGVGDGLAPSTAYWAIEGSVTTHTIVPDGNGTTWDVLVVGNTDATIGEAGTSAVLNTDYSISTAGTATSISIRWLNPAGTGKLYAVQATEVSDDGLCTTVRRSYVGVFGFDVDVLLMTAADGTGATADDPINTDNSWCGDVINNIHDETEIAGLDQALQNNLTALENKETSTFFRVVITLEGAPTGFSLNNLKWRFNYSLQNPQNVNIYDITSLDGAGFGSDGSSTTLIGGVATAALDITADNNNWVYVPRRADASGSEVTTYNYDFEIGHHNMLGGLQTQFEIRIDQVDLEYSTDTGYNNGTKMHTATVGSTGYPTLDDGITGQQQIDHGPATDIIQITD